MTEVGNDGCNNSGRYGNSLLYRWIDCWVETMNDLYKMPPKCWNCPYWEWAEPPYFCDCDKRYENNEIPKNENPDD